MTLKGSTLRKTPAPPPPPPPPLPPPPELMYCSIGMAFWDVHVVAVYRVGSVLVAHDHGGTPRIGQFRTESWARPMRAAETASLYCILSDEEWKPSRSWFMECLGVWNDNRPTNAPGASVVFHYFAA